MPIDLPAFEAATLGDYLANEFVAGSAALHDLTGVRVDTRTAFVDPVDAPSLTRLRSLLFQQLLVREGEVVSEQPNLTPAQPFTLAVDRHHLRRGEHEPDRRKLVERRRTRGGTRDNVSSWACR